MWDMQFQFLEIWLINKNSTDIQKELKQNNVKIPYDCKNAIMREEAKNRCKIKHRIRSQKKCV